ncbi:13038_t:CDS:1 [Acaulospora colombiana]|uniref:13038_t:CDS:1 n=1 Tax=Acaulospora colombiana TaxID=27376 RepID=A0ACA9KP84_9GLOM|nr:13038_t:CDS:1 [Acaulospora colombiana]
MEIWLPIAGSNYFISNIGRIKNRNGRISEGSILKGNGYIRANININGLSTKPYIHRLVAEAFISNPENKPYINHKNGYRDDNRADNLEWVTPKENAERKVFPNRGRGRSRKIVQKTLNGNVVQIWDSITLAGYALNISRNHISACCSRKRNITGGWRWMYYEDYIEQGPNEEWREIEVNLRKFKVSSLGRIQLRNGLISRGSSHSGYLRVEKYYIHRFVALAFCLKEQGKDYVNHLDGRPTNNKASNPKWCTPKENSQHAVHLGLWGHCHRRAVKQVFDDGSTQEFQSISEAQRITGIDGSYIGKVCKGRKARAGGYH